MSEYLVFAGLSHYPLGGLHDFKQDYASYDEALRAVACMSGIDWFQIVRMTESGLTILDEGKRV